MDGTLVDSLILWNVLWKKLGEIYLNDSSFSPSEEDDMAVRTILLKDAMNLIHTKYKLGKSGEELLELANNLIIDFYANEVKLKDGAREFLEYLNKKGVKMCIASATTLELIKVAAKHCGIEEYFCKIFSCGEIGKGKEEPDVFLLAKDYLGESIEDTWVFEDSLVAIETATKIGIKTVGIYDRFNFGQERIKEIVKEYVAEGESLTKLINDDLFV